MAIALHAFSASAETLTRARVRVPYAATLAVALTQRGFDVLEGSVGRTSLDVVGYRADLRALEVEGLPFELLEVGRPLPLQPPTDGYENYEALMERLAALVAPHADIGRMVDITALYGGTATFEARHIQGVRVSDNVADDEDEPAVLVVAAQHAREIGTPLVAFHALEQLFAGYGTDPVITAVVDEHEIWIVPVWNPDGYDYVFSTDNLWRKNRRPVEGGVGVDLNRNYPPGWDATCSGSTDPASETYKGPEAFSEAETQTAREFTSTERFAKVLNVHSFGREIVYSYLCLTNPLADFYQAEAAVVATAAGYASTAFRLPTGEGQHQQFEFAHHGAFGFLIEISEEFQPPLESALAEAAQVWPAVLHMMQRPSSVTGHVRDGCVGDPVTSNIGVEGVVFANGEGNSSGGPFGRFDVFLPAGTHMLTFSADGYRSASFQTTVTDSASSELDVELMPIGECGGGGDGGAGGVPTGGTAGIDGVGGAGAGRDAGTGATGAEGGGGAEQGGAGSGSGGEADAGAPDGRGGSAGVGGAGSGGSKDAPNDDGGCGCRTLTSKSPSLGSVAMWVLLLLVVAGRRGQSVFEKLTLSCVNRYH